jgi:hypothetical protein
VDVSTDAGINLPTGLGDVVVWIDYNNDTYPDFFCSSSSQTSFFKNNSDGTFSDITQQTNLENSTPFSLAVGDYNNDGYADLLITSINMSTPVKVYRNNQGNDFEVVYSTNFHGTRAIWLDFNNDGFIDIFSNTGSNAHLLKNIGNNSFEDVSDGMGFNAFSGETAAAADINNDGLVDIYCCSQSTSKTNRLYLNNAMQSFTDITFSSGTSDFRSGVAQSWGDFNNNGLMDLYIGNISSNRNILFENDDNLHFTDRTSIAGVSDEGDARTNAWIEINNDGLLDLFTTNHVNPNKLYLNNGDGTFSDIAQLAGIDSPQDGFSVSWADYDRDGDLDVLIAGHSYSTKLLRNDLSNPMNFLNVSLKGTYDNRSGIGSRIEIYCSGQVQMMQVNGGRGSVSQDDLSLHFGLGNSEIVDSLAILWPSGMLQKKYTIGANQFITIEQEGNVPPSLFHLLEPVPDSIYTGAELTFRWTSAVDPDATGPINYYINIIGPQNDTVFGPVQDTSCPVEMKSWMTGNPIYWSVTASDGIVTRKSWEEWLLQYSGLTRLTEVANWSNQQFDILSDKFLFTRKSILVDLEIFENVKISATLYQMSGAIVEVINECHLNKGFHTLQLPIHNLHSGTYLLVLQSNHTRKIRKFNYIVY